MSGNAIMAFGYAFILLLSGFFIALTWLTIQHMSNVVVFTRRLYATDNALSWRQIHKVLWYAFWFDADCVSIGDSDRVFFPGREWKP